MFDEKNLDEQAFINKYLPADHNEHDVLYLKARFKWMHSKHGEVAENWKACVKAYEKSTFKNRS